jgi:geranylgeranyl pyrophosphate synthase
MNPMTQERAGTGEVVQTIGSSASGNPYARLEALTDLSLLVTSVNETIERVFEAERGEPKILYDTASHLLQAGGKRIRSLLLILSHQAVGGTIDDIMPYAVATEFMQTASLIHDDLVDDGDLRRGVESTHKKFGNKMAIIAGDLLIALAVKLVGAETSPHMLTMVASVGIKMCEGEANDILLPKSGMRITDEKQYFDVVRNKTASFMRAVARMGAIIGDASPAREDALKAYGENLGIAFQIKDDILDISTNGSKTGKSALADLRGNKPNYVLVRALQSIELKKRREYIQLMQNGEIASALDLIDKTNAMEQAQKTAIEYANRAIQEIEGIGLSDEKALRDLALFSAFREH